jgi:hypothetical protein
MTTPISPTGPPPSPDNAYSNFLFEQLLKFQRLYFDTNRRYSNLASQYNSLKEQYNELVNTLNTISSQYNTQYNTIREEQQLVQAQLSNKAYPTPRPSDYEAFYREWVYLLVQRPIYNLFLAVHNIEPASFFNTVFQFNVALFKNYFTQYGEVLYPQDDEENVTLASNAPVSFNVSLEVSDLHNSVYSIVAFACQPIYRFLIQQRRLTYTSPQNSLPNILTSQNNSIYQANLEAFTRQVAQETNLLVNQAIRVANIYQTVNQNQQAIARGQYTTQDICFCINSQLIALFHTQRYLMNEALNELSDQDATLPMNFLNIDFENISNDRIEDAASVFDEYAISIRELLLEQVVNTQSRSAIIQFFGTILLGYM